MKMSMVQEVDMSDDLLKALKAERIDAVISVVGGRGLSIIYKLQRKGLEYGGASPDRSKTTSPPRHGVRSASTAPSASPSKCWTGR